MMQSQPVKIDSVRRIAGSRCAGTGILLAVCSVIGSPLPSLQAEENSDSRPADAPAIVQIRPLDAAEVEGALASLDEDSVAITVESGQTRTWPLREIRSLRVSREPQEASCAPPVVLLANDDCVYGAAENADEDTLRLSWTAADAKQTLEVPLETVRSFVLRQPDDELARINFRRSWALSQPNTDVLYSTENTHVQGEFIGLADGNARIKNSLGIVRTPLTKTRAVVMNSELLSVPHPEGPYALVSFVDGSRLSLVSLRSSGDGRFTGRTGWGSEISFRQEEVVRVQFLGGRVISLSDLEPAAYKFTPYLTQRYPLVVNRNVKGGRLRLRGNVYAAGLGVSTKSEVSYDLTGGGYDRFEAVVGVDDMTGGLGDVVFAVEVDGERVYESGSLDGKSPAEPVGPIPVAGAKQLKLVVDFGRLGNIQDVADWCDPVLIKPPQQRQ